MTWSQKNCSLLNKHVLITAFVFFAFQIKAQSVANYVSNGSFENYFTSVIYKIPYFWGATDSLKPGGELLTAPNKVPLNNYAYQWPKHGKNYLIMLNYCSTCPSNKRVYPRNRLKQPLKAGRTYCVSFYVNLSNQSTHGIDAIGAYFGDGSLDTIKKCNVPIVYLIPQVVNPQNNIITDTLNWVAITGTFVANGTEKYMMLGNFKDDASTNLSLVNPANLPANAADYLIDQVKCIEVDAPAYAGPDKLIKYGDSVYIGRENDYAIDPYCQWYKLPGMLPLDTISGIWVKPSVTTTYVVKQNIECGSEKVDTVVISVNYVGLNEFEAKNWIKVFPNPATDILYVEPTGVESEIRYVILDQLGQMVREEELILKEKAFAIGLKGLANGAYSIAIKNSKNDMVTKKLLIAK